MDKLSPEYQFLPIICVMLFVVGVHSGYWPPQPTTSRMTVDCRPGMGQECPKWTYCRKSNYKCYPCHRCSRGNWNNDAAHGRCREQYPVKCYADGDLMQCPPLNNAVDCTFPNRTLGTVCNMTCPGNLRKYQLRCVPDKFMTDAVWENTDNSDLPPCLVGDTEILHNLSISVPFTEIVPSPTPKINSKNVYPPNKGADDSPYIIAGAAVGATITAVVIIVIICRKCLIRKLCKPTSEATQDQQTNGIELQEQCHESQSLMQPIPRLSGLYADTPSNSTPSQLSYTLNTADQHSDRQLSLDSSICQHSSRDSELSYSSQSHKAISLENNQDIYSTYQCQCVNCSRDVAVHCSNVVNSDLSKHVQTKQSSSHGTEKTAFNSFNISMSDNTASTTNTSTSHPKLSPKTSTSPSTGSSTVSRPTGSTSGYGSVSSCQGRLPEEGECSCCVSLPPDQSVEITNQPTEHSCSMQATQNSYYSLVSEYPESTHIAEPELHGQGPINLSLPRQTVAKRLPNEPCEIGDSLNSIGSLDLCELKG